MFEKKLYTLSALLSLSCSAYAMDGEVNKDEFASSPSTSIVAGPSSSSPTPDQEIEEVSAQSALFPYDKRKVTFKWSELEEAARDFSREDHRAQNLFDYLCYLRVENCILPDSERWGDTNRLYELPLLQEELSDNPPRRFCNGSLINPLKDKYGKYSEVAWKISTIIGALPSTKDALTQLSMLTKGLLYIPKSHKKREMLLRKEIFWASNTIERERERAAQEREALVSELERLKAENEGLKTLAAKSSD